MWRFEGKIFAARAQEDMPWEIMGDYPSKARNGRLQKAVTNQPVSVAIEAGGREFQLYQSGVSSQGIVVLSWTMVWLRWATSKNNPLGVKMLHHTPAKPHWAYSED